MDIAQKILDGSVFDSVDKRIVTGLTLIGGAAVAKKVLSTLGSFWLHVLRPSPDLLKIYGPGWAVITGGTFGIGMETAKELARKGFNVFIIARSSEKLDTVEKEIKAESPNIEVRTLVFDFKTRNLQDYEDVIKPALSGIISDVAILVNNVGYGRVSTLHETSDEDLWDQFYVNMVGQTYLTKLLI